MTIKTENQIFKDFIILTKAAFTKFSIEGWEVKRLYQFAKSLDLKPAVLLEKRNDHQPSTLYRGNTIVNNAGVKAYRVQNEVTMRFMATKRQSNNETVNTLSSRDILKYLIKYQKGNAGIALLKSLGYAQYKTTDIQPQSFTNDDENIQMLPFFECTYLYTDEWTDSVDRIEKVIYKGIYKI